MSGQKDHLPPQLQELAEQARMAGGLGLLFGALAYFGIGGVKIREFAEQAKHIETQGLELLSIPQKFNERFRQYGWLISESTNIETAKEAISLYDTGDADGANELLCTLFEGDSLDFLLMRMRWLKEFHPRYEIARTAVMLCQAKLYTGAVPLILIVLDGVSSDFFGKSLFATGIDVSEVKALAGSAEGFPQLISEVCKTRKPTNEEPLNFPFRNGIMHGKDVNYGNRIIAAKCWSLLACLGDIMRARKTVTKVREQLNWKEIGQLLMTNARIRKSLDAWVPRTNVPIADSGEFESQSFDEGSPEDLLCQFLSFWKAKNYGKMGAMTIYLERIP